MQTVYLDNSSTTKPCEKAVEYIIDSLKTNWGNPSSLHTMGIEAEIKVSKAREEIANLIHCREDEITFTGSGTEANNTVIMSLINKKHIGKRIITTSIEHPSVLETVKRLKDFGFEVIFLKPYSNGVISLKELEETTDENTALVSIMLVNNEFGSVQPIAEAAKIIKKKAPKALFHCDAVQGFGKLPINVSALGVDFLSASAHKIHGPKGIGFLYCKKGTNFSPFITGGGQEKGLRSGTEAVPLICGFAGAVEALPELNSQLKKQQELYNYAYDKLSEINSVKINTGRNSFPYIMSIALEGYRSETVLHFLDGKGIYVSSGSACSKGELSFVLKEIGLDKKIIDSTLRLSFSRYNTKEDIDILCCELNNAAKTLRKA